MLVSILAGIAGGILFSQLMFLLLLKFVGLPGKLVFRIPFRSVGETILIYLICFFFVTDIRYYQRIESEPHRTFKKQQGRGTGTENQMAGCCCGSGGVRSRLCEGADHLYGFRRSSGLFPAVVLVIIGTYCLFQAGSIALLKALRKNKAFYYKPENFVSVSGMIYRMKQNAAGLASICILSTAVLVTLSSCLSLYAGEEDMLRNQFPREINIYSQIPELTENADSRTEEQGTVTSGLPTAVHEAIDTLSASTGCETENSMEFYQLSLAASYENNSFTTALGNKGSSSMLYVMELADYNRLYGKSYELGAGEALFFTTGTPVEGEADICGEKYRIREQIEKFDITQLLGFATPVDLSVFVVPGLEDMVRLAKAGNALIPDKRFPSYIYYHTFFDIDGSKEAVAAFEDRAAGEIPGITRIYVRNQVRAEFYELYGSILFVGIFFIILFLTATVLIIYYKQITEGYDDRERFGIMEKVGMSAKEVKRTITRQVLMVFFLPLGMAVIHIAVAFPQLCKMMTVFSMTNAGLFAVFTILSVLLFGLAYLLVYRLTARTYFKIVQS